MEVAFETDIPKMAEDMFRCLKNRFSGITMNIAGPIDNKYFVRIDPITRAEIKTQIRLYIEGYKSGIEVAKLMWEAAQIAAGKELN